MSAPSPAPDQGSDHVIEVSHLERTFGPFRAVDDVSFHVERGEIFGYLGANGAGKSTTIRMLSGLLAPTGGQATVAGHDIAKAPDEVKASIGYMSQKFSLYTDLSVAQNFDFFGGIYGLKKKEIHARVEELSAALDLGPLLSEITGSLPGGLRQRVALASALLPEPEIVFLDEPTAGVDPVSRRSFWALIRGLARQGTTVFVTTHYMDEAEYCARIGMMVAGRLVALDTPSALKKAWVPGTMLAVAARADQDKTQAAGALRKVIARLSEAPGIIAVEAFGAGLHVRFDDGAVTDDAVRALTTNAAEGMPLVITPTVATLEHVFLAAADAGSEARIRKEQGEGKQAPATPDAAGAPS